MMKFLPLLFCIIILLTKTHSTEVTLANLKGFFWATYDRNDDGIATLQ